MLPVPHSALLRPRLRVPVLPLAAFSLLAASACLRSSAFEVGVPLNCSSLASALEANASTLTTTSSGLRYRDEVVGTGATVATGQRVSVRYAGCLTNGSRFDSNEAPQPLLEFRVGTGAVIRGFDEGVVGMKVGGRRQLVIPPNLAYGSTGAGGVIPPNATLVFTIEAVGVTP